MIAKAVPTLVPQQSDLPRWTWRSNRALHVWTDIWCHRDIHHFSKILYIFCPYGVSHGRRKWGRSYRGQIGTYLHSCNIPALSMSCRVLSYVSEGLFSQQVHTDRFLIIYLRHCHLRLIRFTKILSMRALTYWNLFLI